MTDQMQAIHDDLAYMKALAAEGKRTPLLGGAVGLAAGLIFGVASLVCWAIQRGIIAAPLMWQAWIWLGAFVLFMGALVVLVGRSHRKPGASATTNRAVKAVWKGAGLAIFVLALGTIYLTSRFNTWLVWAAFCSIILALYGVCWTVSAAMSDRKWMWWIAYGSFAGSLGMALMIGTGFEYLAYAIGLFLFAALPGWLMMRDEPSEIV